MPIYGLLICADSQFAILVCHLLICIVLKMLEITTHNAAQTKKIAFALAKEIVKSPGGKGAFVIALEGNLGAGKTTFVQGFAKGLGIKEIPKSPTFVLMNIYSFGKTLNAKRQTLKLTHKYKHLVHIDCYRIASAKELAHLGIKEIFKDPHNIVLIEWAEKIEKVIPQDVLWLKFIHGKSAHERVLNIKSKFQNPNVK
jgi:tRNA threonylcarbamoyladenosine biosynthesis protein TsaE